MRKPKGRKEEEYEKEKENHLKDRNWNEGKIEV